MTQYFEISCKISGKIFNIQGYLKILKKPHHISDMLRYLKLGLSENN